MTKKSFFHWSVVCTVKVSKITGVMEVVTFDITLHRLRSISYWYIIRLKNGVQSFCIIHWKLRVVKMPALLSLVALQVVVMTTCGAINDDNVNQHYGNSQFSVTGFDTSWFDPYDSGWFQGCVSLDPSKISKSGWWGLQLDAWQLCNSLWYGLINSKLHINKKIYFLYHTTSDGVTVQCFKPPSWPLMDGLDLWPQLIYTLSWESQHEEI